MILSILFWTGTVLAFGYCAVVLFLYRGLLSLAPAGKSQGHHFSVVIAARNEAENIGPCLDSIFAQTIPHDRFEVIVADDRSTDDTASILKEYRDRFPRLSIVRVASTPPGLSPKKHAISEGVALAAHEIVVFTDADCRVPPAWLETIDRFFTPSVGVVQGITSYSRIPGMNRLFYRLQSLDFLSHGIVAAAAIGARFPLNSNANNFSFRKEAFTLSGGMKERIGHVVSGDDDLLLQKIWETGKWDIAYMADLRGAVETAPTPTPGALFQQRARWGSKTIHYRRGQVLLLGTVFLFYTMCAFSLGLSPFLKGLPPFALFLLVTKFAGEFLLMVHGSRLFGKRELLPLLPLASILQLPMVLAAVLTGVFGKFSWKGQSFSRTINRAVPPQRISRKKGNGNGKPVDNHLPRKIR